MIDKERAKRAAAQETVWLFGLHAVRDALLNPRREKLRLVVTKNAYDKLADAITASGVEPEVVDPRKFDVPIDESSVHQGAALEVKPLHWGSLAEVCIEGRGAPLVVLLDRVTDPHNVGAVLRSAEVFGARAVIGPLRHSAPETGALAKTASGALERQPYLRVTNLADAMVELREMGFVLLGLDGAAETTVAEAVAEAGSRPIALVMGAEGPGLREKTRETCDRLVRIMPGASLARSMCRMRRRWRFMRCRSADIHGFAIVPLTLSQGPHMRMTKFGLEPPSFLLLSLVPHLAPGLSGRFFLG